MAVQKMKGTILKSRVDFMKDRFGPGALDRILPKLRGPTKEVMSRPDRIRATGWYDFSVNRELDEAICQVLAGGDTSVYQEMGAFSNKFQGDRSTVDIYTNPWKFLEMHCLLFPRFWKPGRMELIRVGEGEAYVRFHEVRSTWANCQTNMGFIKRGLNMCGAEEVKVEETQCNENRKYDYCEFHITFRF